MFHVRQRRLSAQGELMQMQHHVSIPTTKNKSRSGHETLLKAMADAWYRALRMSMNAYSMSSS